MSAVIKWISSKILSPKTLRAEDYVRQTEPTNCPICNAKIERKVADDGTLSDEYVCIGLASREEVLEYLPGKTPAFVVAIPPCGWHARADEYGKTWE